jgi:hypothetical protein
MSVGYLILRMSMVGVVALLAGCSPARPDDVTKPPLPPPPPPPVTSKYALTGTIQESTPEGRRPVAGAHVSIPALGETTMTDETGSYSFPAVPLGTFLVSVRSQFHDPVSRTVQLDRDTQLDFDLLRLFAGEITLKGMTPAPGVTLTVGECEVASVGGRRLCSDAWHGTLEVVGNRSLDFAVLSIDFYNGDTFCGFASATLALGAGQRVSMTLSPIYLSWEQHTGGGSSRRIQPCQLPLTTTRMVASIWTPDTETVFLETRLPGEYTFIQQ